MSNITITIDNTEVVCSNEIVINKSMAQPGSVILKNCYPKSWEQDKDYTSRYFKPKDYSKVVIKEDGDLIFAGVLKNSGYITLNPNDTKFSDFQVIDFATFLSEGVTLDFVIDNKTIYEAISQVVNAIADYGIEVGYLNIENHNDKIMSYSTVDKTAYDVLSYIAEVSGCVWWTEIHEVDGDFKVWVNMYTPEHMENIAWIDYNEILDDWDDIMDITYSINTNDYRNKQVITSNLVYAETNTVENITADGYATTFILTRPVGKINSIKVNDVSKTIATLNEQQIGIYADFYYEIENNEITSQNVIGYNDIITVDYVPLIQGRQQAINSSERQRISQQLGINGTLARYETRNDIVNLTELGKVANTYLKYKGIPQIEVKLTMQNFDYRGVYRYNNIGHTLNLTNFPVDELNGYYMIKGEQHTIIHTDNQDSIIITTLTMVNNYNIENELNYFNNQRRKSTGNLKQDEFVTRNIDNVVECVVIGNGYTIEEVEDVEFGEHGNLLQFGLGIPLINE